MSSRRVIAVGLLSFASAFIVGCADKATSITAPGSRPTPQAAQFTVTATGPQTFHVDSKGSFILGEAADTPHLPLVIDISALGVGPGDFLHLDQLGSFTYSIYFPAFVNFGTESGTALEAVFSSSNQLLAPSVLHRVPGAIGIGANFITPVTLFQHLVTDIPEDFFARNITVRIPAGARYLFVAIPDSWYKDNADVNGDFSVRVTPMPAPPTIAVAVTPSLPASGWYTTDVSVTWTVTGQLTSSTGCEPVTITADTPGTTYTCSAATPGGSATKSIFIKRDATPPVLTFSGNSGTYTVDQTILISCSASDAMSGLASSVCPSASGAAYTFPLGANTLVATASDVAGNQSSASSTFTVSVTAASLCALVERFADNGGIANSLCVKLSHGDYGAFRNELSAQSGKHISTDDAALLLRLVNALSA